MGLTTEQKQYIENLYDRRKINNELLRKQRVDEVYNKAPEIKALIDERIKLSNQALRASMAGDDELINSLPEKFKEIEDKKSALLLSYGYTSDYLDPIFTCDECKDTGYINGKPCSCMKSEITKLLYYRTDLGDILERENFNTFNMDYYSKEIVDTDVVDPHTGQPLTSYDNMANVVQVCKDFVKNFDSTNRNLLFYGPAGTGKTFLTNCIAKELLETTHSVVYLSATQLFELMADYSFDKQKSSLYNIISASDINTCDLLIIDDLGTEMSNSFTESTLFTVLNERIIHHKPIIISTNFSFEQLQERYDDRIFSRIIGNFADLKIFGVDIRINKTI